MQHQQSYYPFWHYPEEDPNLTYAVSFMRNHISTLETLLTCMYGDHDCENEYNIRSELWYFKCKLLERQLVSLDSLETE